MRQQRSAALPPPTTSRHGGQHRLPHVLAKDGFAARLATVRPMAGGRARWQPQAGLRGPPLPTLATYITPPPDPTPMTPDPFPRRILLVVTGLTPQVVTETVYALAVVANPPWLPTELHLLTTREGAAVAITVPGSACQRVPARRVGRVVILGELTVPVLALTLFSERGVPVTFLDRAGRTRGSCAIRIPQRIRVVAAGSAFCAPTRCRETRCAGSTRRTGAACSSGRWRRSNPRWANGRANVGFATRATRSGCWPRRARGRHGRRGAWSATPS